MAYDDSVEGRFRTESKPEEEITRTLSIVTCVQCLSSGGSRHAVFVVVVIDKHETNRDKWVAATLRP
ncbi:hypothetical protein RDWZM_008305 [Blomia tropicalis]|uniref:Uncharacterized protein n=1 Tax=Blomia tropicalis TaxID=40697 RepID=A0A9Q0RIR3_BLOTA|nr:hypothetical protein RDWZM_008305 [Blomia tropicalis]